MKKSLLLSSFLLFSLKLSAQFFPYQGSVPAGIPDSNVNADFPIMALGLPAQIDSTFGLAEVCVDITHPQVSDLKISLTSPDGTTIVLSLHNGMGGSNYPGTCFQMNAGQPISSVVAPFIGSFIPDESLNFLNNGQDPNGIWTLTVLDAFPFYSGQLNTWSLSFSINPPPDPAVMQGLCTTTNAAGCSCKDTTLNDCDLLPDLTCSYVIIRNGWNEYAGSVDMPNAVIDIGSGPVEMRPTNVCFCDTVNVPCNTILCPDSSAPRELVNQRIYHKNPNGQMSFHDTPAGTQSFHPTHNHVHAEEFMEFSLRVATPDPDPVSWPIIGKSVKQGYCMINMGDCDGVDSICMSHGQVITNAMLPNYNLGTITGCGNQGQGVYVGRYDLYGAGFGQTINLTNVCNGDYYLVANIDPHNHFTEEDETNNAIAVPVHLTKQAGMPLPAAFTYTVTGFIAGFFNYTPNVTRTWDFGDGTVLVHPMPVHQYQNPGTYIVKLTVSDSSCATTSAQTVIVSNISTGIHDITGLFNLEVYPNPAAKDFTVSYELAEPTAVTIGLFNVIGEKITEFDEGMRMAGKHEKKISSLQPGSYLLRLNAGEHVYFKRVTILR